MKSPGMLQKEWDSLLEVDPHADRIVGLLNIPYGIQRQNMLHSVTARVSQVDPEANLDGSSGS